MTSVGCSPVASLAVAARTISPNNVEDTNSFDGDAMYAQQLQEEEYEAARVRRLTTTTGEKNRRRSASLEEPNRTFSGSFAVKPQLEDLKIAAVPDRGVPITRQSKQPAKRIKSVRETEPLCLVPLDPEETRRSHLKDVCPEEARKFVQRLRSIAADAIVATVSSVLVDGELINLVQSMFQTQAAFRNEGKPTKVNIGFHFCRGSNITRIQQQPGLWSKIQSRGLNQSQDGEGIYTYNCPPSEDTNAAATAILNEDNVYLIGARLEGNQAPLMKSNTVSRRQWSAAIDSLSEGDIVVLKASSQFIPLLQFRSDLLVQDAGRLQGNLRMLQLLRDRLQYMLNDFFNAGSVVLGNHAASPMHRSLSSPAVPAGTQQSVAIEGEKVHHLRRPQSFQESVDEVSNPAAWSLAREVQAFVDEHEVLASASMEPPLLLQTVVEVEELAVLANNMLETQERISGAEYVDIAYHYCRGQNLRKMQKAGFWANIQLKGFNKSEDGDGVYTFKTPMRGNRNRSGFFDVRQSSGSTDDVWLLVARIQGTQEDSSPSNSDAEIGARQWNEGIDSIILAGQQSDQVVVLKSSTQFFPIVQFRASDVHSTSDTFQDDIVREIQMVHQRLQGILDELFNTDASMKQPRIPKEEILEYEAPEALDTKRSVQGSSQQVYTVLSSNKKAAKDDCSICLDSLRRTSNQQVVKLNVCGHFFHRSCLHEALYRFVRCPICNQEVTPAVPQMCLQGVSPPGTMIVRPASQIFCSGVWSPRGSFVVSYFLPSGIQKSYHESPGLSHTSANWETYLPSNKQGTRLLRRLQYAFLHGLLFSVGATVHGRDGVLWECVTHKTQPGNNSGLTNNGTHNSFPDPTYFERCHNELDRCGVPDGNECDQLVNTKLQYQTTEAKKTPPAVTQIMATRSCRLCQRVLRGLREHTHGWMFCKAPALDQKVSKTMDFETIQEKLTKQEYTCPDGFGRDVSLIFENAMMCHGKENPVYFMASQLKKKFKKDFKDMQLKIER